MSSAKGGKWSSNEYFRLYLFVPFYIMFMWCDVNTSEQIVVGKVYSQEMFQEMFRYA